MSEKEKSYAVKTIIYFDTPEDEAPQQVVRDVTAVLNQDEALSCYDKVSLTFSFLPESQTAVSFRLPCENADAKSAENYAKHCVENARERFAEKGYHITQTAFLAKERDTRPIAEPEPRRKRRRLFNKIKEYVR